METFYIDNMKKLISMANELDSHGLMSVADYIDEDIEIIHKIFSLKKELSDHEKIMSSLFDKYSAHIENIATENKEEWRDIKDDLWQQIEEVRSHISKLKNEIKKEKMHLGERGDIKITETERKPTDWDVVQTT